MFYHISKLFYSLVGGLGCPGGQDKVCLYHRKDSVRDILKMCSSIFLVSFEAYVFFKLGSFSPGGFLDGRGKVLCVRVLCRILVR